MGVYGGSSVYNGSGNSQVTQEWVENEIEKNGKGVFFAEIGTTPYNDVLTAYNAGKIIIGKISENTVYGVDTHYYPLYEYETNNDEGDNFIFGEIPIGTGNSFTYWILHIWGGWSSKYTGPLIIIDDRLNPLSTNPVQNAVVFAAINAMAMQDKGNKTESDIVNGKFSIDGQNSTTKLDLTSVSTLTILSNVGVPNFAITIDNSLNANDVSISVKTNDELTTLYHSKAGGTSVLAGSIVQITALGNCWTLAEFEV